jgi:paraquat-inducible protein B
MGKKASPTIIGAFVVGAVALAVLGVIVFGSGQYFKHLERFVLFFPGSVNGLSVGASVKFKGVDIGHVSDIRLVLRREEGNKDDNRAITIPVYVEFDPSKVTFDGHTLEMSDPANLQRLIQRGLRGQLQAQSLVTGLLFVQIDFFPDSPITFILPQPSNPIEIPTVPTTLEEASTAAREIIDELRNLKLGPLVQDASEALENANKLLSSPALHNTVDALPNTINQLNQTIASFHDLSEDVRGRVTPLASRLDSTLVGADQTFSSVRETASSARVLIEPGSPLDHDLRATLRDVGSAARSLAQLADFLQQNPTALLYGQQPPPKEKR